MKIDDTVQVSVNVPGVTQTIAFGKQPTPVGETKGTPRSGREGEPTMTDAARRFDHSPRNSKPRGQDGRTTLLRHCECHDLSPSLAAANDPSSVTA
jgi:hypothetical protein